MSLPNKIHLIPFVKILLSVVSGILVADFVRVDLSQSVLFCLSALVVLAWILTLVIKRNLVRNIYFYFTLILFSFTFTLAQSSNGQKDALYDTYATWTVIVDRAASSSGRWTKSTARLSNYKRDQGADWHTAQGRVFIYADSSIKFKVGDQLSFKGRLNRFQFAGNQDDSLAVSSFDKYASLMWRRDFVGNMFIYESSLLAKSTLSSPSLITRFARLQQKALEKLSSLKLKPQNKGIVEAMLLGYRSNIDRSLSESYSRVGASHILAVSGLHVGIIFLFLNILLRPLVLFSQGHRVINIISILALWFYGLLTGLSFSVIRAVMMFSIMQFALFSSQRNFSLNALFATATLMLLLNPNTLFDISFLLSFTAVFFIVTCFNPCYRRLESRRKWLNALSSVLLVGLIASVATMGLISYNFDNMPLLGVLLNPFVVLLASCILFFGVLALLCPFAFIVGWFAVLIDFCVDMLNGLILMCARWSIASASYSFSFGFVVIYYLVLGYLAFALWSRSFDNNTINTYDDDK